MEKSDFLHEDNRTTLQEFVVLVGSQNFIGVSNRDDGIYIEVGKIHCFDDERIVARTIATNLVGSIFGVVCHTFDDDFVIVKIFMTVNYRRNQSDDMAEGLDTLKKPLTRFRCL